MVQTWRHKRCHSPAQGRWPLPCTNGQVCCKIDEVKAPGCTLRRWSVPYVITSPCIGTQDQSCVEVCPVDCIHFEEGVDRMLYINPLESIDCGACQPACPVNAIFPQA